MGQRKDVAVAELRGGIECWPLNSPRTVSGCCMFRPGFRGIGPERLERSNKIYDNYDMQNDCVCWHIELVY